MTRTIPAALALSLLAAACAGSGDSAPTSVVTASAPSATAAPTSGDDTEPTTMGPATTPSPPTTAAATPASAIGTADIGLTGLTAQLADLRTTNGFSLPIDAALDLFATGFGAVPGADPDRFEFRDRDGTMAMMEVLAHWDSLAPDQQDEVRARLGYPGRRSLRSTPRQAPDPALQAQIDDARAAIAARLGTDVSFRVEGEVWDEIVTEDGRTVLGVAIPERAGDVATSGRIDRCRIAFPVSPAPTQSTIAHEVFHCFQYHLAADVADVLTGQKWIIEGSAEWAGAEVMGVDADVVAHFKEWVDNTGSVFALDYGAVGFYWVVESMGIDPWPVVGSMLGRGGTDAIAAMGLEPGEVLNRVATSIARSLESPTLSGISPSWDFADDEVPPGGVRSEATVTVDEPFEDELPRGGYARGSVSLLKLEGGDRVQVLIDSDVGTAQFFEKESLPYTGGLHREFCLEPGGCRCGVGDSVDPGLGEGSRELILGAGELEGGPITSTVRIPDPEGAFTDGRWVGTITSSMLAIMSDGTTGERTATTAPFEITVADGAVTSGSYSLSFAAQTRTPAGTGQGVVTIVGVFDGCGFSPQMQGTHLSLHGTMTVGDVTVPLESEIPLTPIEGAAGTFWVPAPVTDPAARTGVIDASPQLASIGAAGFVVSGMEITFEARRGS